MNPCRRHRIPCRWQFVLAAALSLAPGCSWNPEPQDMLVPSWDSHGIVTYHYVSSNQPAAEAPTAASSTSLDDMLQQELAEAEDRRRQAILAEQEMRREREAQWRQRLEEEAAEREARWRELRERRLQEQEQRRAYQHQLSRWLQDRKLRGEAEAEAWRRAAQPFDILGPQATR